MTIEGYGAGALTPRQRTANLLPELAPYWERYTSPAAQAAMRPLWVACDVAGPMGGYDPPTLDGLLARMVVDEAFGGAALDDSRSPYLLPVPLQLAWRHPLTRLPLWAANTFLPVGASSRTTIYSHRRQIRPEHATRRKGGPVINSMAGRYKEIRIPMPAVAARRWMADCVGDEQEVARLLRACSALGKRRLARVTAWYVIPAEEPFCFRRPVPVEYLGEAAPDRAADVFCGWTPPYWPGSPECQGWCAVPDRAGEAAACTA